MMEQTNNSTETLLASFQAGNMAAFSQLYDLHVRILFNYGLKLTLDKELLKDCIHDIFVKLYVKKDELGTIDNLKSYLFISLKNKLCDELRRRMYMSDTAVEEVNAISSMDVEEDYVEEEQQKKYEDICDIMDMNYQSVRNLMHRGLTKLRALVS